MPGRWQLDASLLFPQEKQQDPWECTQEVYSTAVLNENALGRAVEGLTDFHLAFALAWIHFPWSDEECYSWDPRVGAVAGHVWKSHFYHLASREHLPFLPLVQKEKRVMSLKETLWNQSLAGFSTGKWEHQWENESINDLIHTGDTTWHYLLLPLHGQAEMVWKGRRTWQWRSCQCMVKISS